MRVAVVGSGAVGARAARQLTTTDAVDEVLLWDHDPERLEAVTASLGERTTAMSSIDEALGADAVILAVPDADHPALAVAVIRVGGHVVSVADGMDSVEALLGLDHEARELGRSVVVGSGFSPGLSCVLARHAASSFDHVDEVHVARVGTGGPSCARQHHRALGGRAPDWRDGGWQRRPGGSGRELMWFPDPIAGRDCYRAALPDALLLVPAFPGVQRVTARLAANRRDRLTARFPMLRPPHPEGGPGGLRVEVRGRRGLANETLVLGVMDRPAVAAGATAAVAAVWAVEDRFGRRGAAGLAELAEPIPFLDELHRRGVRAAVFEGSDATGS